MDLTIGNIVFAAFLFVLIAITVIGNFLIVIAWFINPKIRTPSNLLLVSLAIPDLIIGGLSVSLSAVQLLTQGWPFGLITCRSSIVVTIIMGFVSSAHLVLIAWDRYKIVTYGVAYIQHQSLRTASQAVGLVYLIGLCITSPYIFDWETTGEFFESDEKIACFFKETSAFILYLITFIRFLPAVIMVVLYWKIFKALKLRLRRNWATTGNSSLTDNTATQSEETLEINEAGQRSNNGDRDRDNDNKPIDDMGKNLKPNEITRKEWRAARTLGILIGCFVICWLPYCTVSLLKAIFDVKTPRKIYLASLVMGWINSAVNPFVYAVHNRDFKQAFKTIIGFIFPCLKN